MARKDPEALAEASPPAASSSNNNDSGSDSDSDSNEYESSSEHKSPNNSNNHSSSSSSDHEVDQQLPQPPQKKLDPPIKPEITAHPGDSNKRKNENTESSDKGLTSKKAKKDKNEPSGSTLVPDEGGKKPLFQRLWNEDDEIAILTGMIEFKAKKGKDPMSDVTAFLDFIKDSLHVIDVKKEQIVSKVRRLKDRYRNAKKRTLTNPHELHAFELSKTIWGGADDGVGVDENDNGMSAKNPLNKTKSKVSRDEKIKSDEAHAVSGGVVMTGIHLAELNKFGDVDEEFMNQGLKLVRDDERNALEEEWFNFNVIQIEGLVKRLEMYQKTAKVLLNAVKSNKR